MDDGRSDDHTEEFDPFAGAGTEGADALVTEPESDPWPGAGARRSPRPPAEGVRIIGADEAAAAIESGQATRRSPGDAPRFGDVPPQPRGPRPPLRFPGADPAAVAKAPIASPPLRPQEGRGGPDHRDSYVEERFWDEPADRPAETPGTWSASGEWAQGPSGPYEREAQGPSGPYEREAQGPSGPYEREAQGPSGPYEREAQGPSGPYEREAQGPSGASEWVGAGMSGQSRAYGAAPGASEPIGRGGNAPGDYGAPGGSFAPRSSFDPGPPHDRTGDLGPEPEDDRYAGLPGDGEEYEYEPFFAPTPPVDQGPSGPYERATQGPSGPYERATQGPSGPYERATQGPSGPYEGEAQGPSGPGGPEERGAQGPGGAPGSGPALPHWTEPPSGEHPRILGDTEPEPDSDDDLKAWSTLSTGPRWRDQPTDWDEADFGGAAVLDDPEMRLGALRTELPEEDVPYGVEEPPAAPAGPARPGPSGRFRRSGPVPADPGASPMAPQAARRSRRDPMARVGPGAGRKQQRLRPGVGDPTAPRQPSGPGGGLSQMGGHELQIRVITGAIVLAVLLVAAKLGPGPLAFVVAVVLTMAAAELYQAVRTHGYHPATLLGLAATAALVAVAYWRPGDGSAYLLVPVLLVVFSFLWFLAGVSRARPLANIGLTLMGFMYVGFLGSFAATILTFPADHGIGILLGAILATAAYDTGAYFVGAWTGRTPLMPHISPGKTVEGLVGGTFATLVMCIILVRAIYPWDGGRAFWLFVVVSVVAPLGDLCESMIKRELGVKDMGGVMPGHGGVLDRIDALLFVIPATFYLTRVLNFA